MMKKKINNEILLDYFKFRNSSLLLKDLHTKNNTKRKQILCMIDNALIDLRNDFSKKNVDKNDGLYKVTLMENKILLDKSLAFIINKKIKALKYKHLN